MFDGSAPGSETEGPLAMAISSPLQLARQRVGLSVNRTHTVCVRVPNSSTRKRRLELSIGRRRWSLGERTTWTPPLHTRLADRALCAYKTPGHRRILRLQNRKTGLGRPRAKRPAGTKSRPRPPPPGNDQPISVPQNTPQTGLWENRADVVRAARRTRFESPDISVSSSANAFPLQRKTND